MPRRKKKRKQQQVSMPRPKPQPKRNQFVIRHQDGWAVKKEGSNRITAFFQTQGEAIEYGRDLAITQRCELVIHDRKGNVRERRNYRDPRHAILRHERILAKYQAERALREALKQASENAVS
ncbi:MAG: DUF2188 domain-containing protein [Leptolyngbya sp. Prado105]|jgi:hypothetical protein|nr:DUF2188 domain-containing protein [Leptolyngbya sp. Prado105]